jgi:hypothetical protein
MIVCSITTLGCRSIDYCVGLCFFEVTGEFSIIKVDETQLW